MHTLVAIVGWVLFWPVILLCKSKQCGIGPGSDNEINSNQVLPQPREDGGNEIPSNAMFNDHEEEF
jgi:hypothetical protein